MKIDKKFKGLYDLKNASIKTGRAESTLKTLVHQGRFQVGKDVLKFGNSWVFTEEALERYCESVDNKSKKECK
ncbi:MAG: hypothetical protein ACRDB0_05000 [Paraclostridium sp.]